MTQAQVAGATVSRDVNGEQTYTYSSHTVFFQDATSYRRKVDAVLAANPAVGGFAHWRVGAEDPATWEIVGTVQRTGSTPIEEPAKDFAINGPSAMSVEAGAEAAAGFGYSGINGFADAVSVTRWRNRKLP